MSANWLEELSTLTPEMAQEYLRFQAEYAEVIAQGNGMEVLACGMLATAFVREIASLPASRIKAVFDAIEQYANTGDERIGTAICTGFLESLVHRDSSNEFSLEPFSALIGPECRAYIRAYDEFTGVRTRGLWP